MDIDGALLIPFHSLSGQLQTFQRIYPDGSKRLAKGGVKEAAFLAIGADVFNAEEIYFVEGFATGVTLARHVNSPSCSIVVCIDKGNLPKVIRKFRDYCLPAKFTICADNDHQSSGNPGLSMATVTARELRTDILYPAFTIEHKGCSDFNDWANLPVGKHPQLIRKKAASIQREALNTGQTEAFKMSISPAAAVYRVSALLELGKKAKLSVNDKQIMMNCCHSYMHSVGVSQSEIAKTLGHWTQAIGTLYEGEAIVRYEVSPADWSAYFNMHRGESRKPSKIVQPLHKRNPKDKSTLSRGISEALKCAHLKCKNTLLASEAGAGKTREAVAQIAQFAAANPDKTISYLVPDLKLGAEVYESFKKYCVSNNLHISIGFIKGRASACDAKPELIAALKESKNPYAHSNLCKVCPKKDTSCPYELQFGEVLSDEEGQEHKQAKKYNIRIQTSNVLTTPISKEDEFSVPSPDITYIDEDFSKQIYGNYEFTAQDSQTWKQIIRDVEDKNYGGLQAYASALATDAVNALRKLTAEEEEKKQAEKPMVNYEGAMSGEVSTESFRLQLEQYNEWVQEHSRKLGKWRKLQDVLGVMELIGETSKCLRFDGDKAYLNHRKEVQYRFSNSTFICLDATGQLKVASELLNKSDMVEVKLDCKYQGLASVSQCYDRLFSKKQLEEDGSIDEAIKVMRSMAKGRMAAVVTHKAFLHHFEGTEFMTANFGNTRGHNRFSEAGVQVLFVLGRYQVPEYAIENFQRSIWSYDTPDMTQEYIETGYLMSDPSHPNDTKTLVYAHPRTQAIKEMMSDAETYQALHRMRMIHSKHRCQVVLLTNEVQRVTVDELFSYDAVKKQVLLKDKIKAEGFSTVWFSRKDGIGEVSRVNDYGEFASDLKKPAAKKHRLNMVLSHPADYLMCEWSYVVKTKERKKKTGSVLVPINMQENEVIALIESKQDAQLWELERIPAGVQTEYPDMQKISFDEAYELLKPREEAA
ncbi:hypothetical protein [Sansalvadorimonas verongulae]|uniref:hypothetical protein n=1 Tax=Sansalvadorimonas verongulae TaxID=2172824 RepID=UPI0018AD1513|nr:hypothetical protein [Sansalvadorimonas verongulae]